jgi:hypothetical protein
MEEDYKVDDVFYCFLVEFIQELISSWKAHKLSSSDLLSLVKVLRISENPYSLKFDGLLEIEVGYTLASGGANYISLFIDKSEMVLSQWGVEVDPDVGSDTIYNEYFRTRQINCHPNQFPVETFYVWKSGFYQMMEDGHKVKINDQIKLTTNCESY